MIQQLKALGEPTRLSLAIRLSRREWGAMELVNALKVSQPSLSRHVRILREARLIRERRDGRNSFYSLLDNDLAQAVILLAQGLPLASVVVMAEGTKNQRINIDKSKVSSQKTDKGDEGEPQSPSIEEWLL
jgi:DNA-binding transcriptional ArsR family regulator